MFSNGCGSSISLATVTPSFVTRGLPNDFCNTTLRPRGPSVAFTARASCDRPLAISARASVSNFICFAAIACSGCFVHHGGTETRRRIRCSEPHCISSAIPKISFPFAMRHGTSSAPPCLRASVVQLVGLLQHAEDVVLAEDDELLALY